MRIMQMLPTSIKKPLGRLKIRCIKMGATLIPKRDQVLFFDPWSISPNTVELANYLVNHIDKPVYYAVSPQFMEQIRAFLPHSVYLINRNSWKFKLLFLQSKYFFTAQWGFPKYATKKQTLVNLWHGIPYKKIRKLKSPTSSGLYADFTIATSKLTQHILAKAFGVSEKSTLITGYPRNDILLRTIESRKEWLPEVLPEATEYESIIVWLPTYRKDIGTSGVSVDGKAVNNVFQVENFNIERFNSILKTHNTLCLVKPHPVAEQENPTLEMSNISIINDAWLWKNKITVYHLAACTDALISDVSSIIVDYLLIDKPILCFSADFEIYKEGRGFVFDDMEEWMPSPILKTQDEFFSHLEKTLTNGNDGYEQKRERLRNQFFAYQDAQSAKRLTQIIFDRTSRNP